MRPDFAIMVSAVLWGTIWIPVRQLGGAGWDPDLAIGVSGVIAVAALLPLLSYRRRRSSLAGSRVWLLGLIFAFGLALYLEAIVRGNVARMVLLFYLMPVWSAIFGRIFRGDPITVRRIAGIVLGLSGLAVIFYDGTAIPLPAGAADFMALCSGVVWAMAFTYADAGDSKVPDPALAQALSTLVLLGPFLYVLSLVPGGREAAVVGAFSAGPMAGPVWLIALAVVWLLPAVTLTLFGAGRLQPSQASIFMMLEVAIALVSAALLIDEPFGMRETVGAILIIGASFAEFIGRTKK